MSAEGTIRVSRISLNSGKYHGHIPDFEMGPQNSSVFFSSNMKSVVSPTFTKSHESW